MSNKDQNTGNSNWIPSNPLGKTSLAGILPNSNGALVLGIVSVCVSTVCCCCCFGPLAGFIISIIGLVLGKKAIRKYKKNPTIYNLKSYKKVKTAQVLNWIGLILSILACIAIILYFYLAFTGQLPPQLQEQFDGNRKNYDFD